MKIPIGHSVAGNKSIAFALDLLLKSRLLITADSGGGKSWLIRKLAEELFGKVPVFLIDPEGEMSTLREKFDYVLVGPGGETPANPRSAALVAHRLLELNASAVCDLYELKHHDRHLWVSLFLESLIEAPKKLWHPVIVLVDEAHVFCPEKGKGESIASQAMIDICTRGRKRGICAIFATQRLGMLNKDASSNLQNRLIGPTFEDVNRKRAAELLGVQPGASEREFNHQMQTLEPGTFWAFGRAISTERVLVKIGAVKTSHPEMGTGKHAFVPPPPSAKVRGMLPKLADLPQEAEQKAKTEAELHREIRELKAKNQQLERNALKPAPAPAAVMDPRVIEREVAKATAPLTRRIELMQKQGAQAMKALSALSELGIPVPGVVDTLGKVVNGSGVIPVTPVTPVTPAPARQPEPKPVRISDGSVTIGKLHQQIAAILAAYYPDSIETDLLAAMVGRSPGGSFSARLSECRGAGLLDDSERGKVKATEQAAREYIGKFQVPTTTAEVRALWDPKIGDLHKRMLDCLIASGGEPVRVEDLAEVVGRVAGGSFSARISELRATGLLVDAGRGFVAANKKALFL